MNILDAANQAGISLKKVASTKGGEYTGPCPGCGGTDRFHVWPADKGGEGSYWCRQCEKSGDLVQFFVDFMHYEYPAAFKAAGRSESSQGFYREAALGPRKAITPAAEQSFAPRQHEPPCETWRMKAQKFSDAAHQNLLNYSSAMEYLADRGIDERVIFNFHLGWFSGENGQPNMFRPRRSWGLSEMKNEKTGKNKKLWLPRGFVIPCFDADGKIHRLRIRRPKADIKSEQDIKYYIVPGSGMEVFSAGLDRQTIVVMESELDAMMVSRYVSQKAGVIGLGSAAIKPGASVFYHLKKALRVLIALDYDEAGINAWRWWHENFPQAKIWPVLQGKDPGEAYALKMDIRQWIYAGLPAVQQIDIDPKSSPEYTPPPGMTEFQEILFLLKSYPVSLFATSSKQEVQVSPDFKNPGVVQRIKKLFFDNDEIYCYFCIAHPDDIITGSNCDIDITKIQQELELEKAQPKTPNIE